MRRWIIQIGLLTFALSLAGGARAGGNPFIIEPVKPAFSATFAARYWYGMGNESKDLYGLTRDTLNSRLTYDGLQSHSLEGFARVDHNSGLFWKAYVGGGLLTQGHLQDEDFPPGIDPYSSTNSTLQNQSLFYASVDVGGALVRGSDFRVDAFVGYHYFRERMKAFGCAQTAGNTEICGTPIPDDVAAIVEDSNWQGVRVGLNADLPLFDRWRINVEGAYLPYVWYNGTDNHLLRWDLPSPIRQDGHGWGYQLEAVLSYQLTNEIALGVGGRYWHFQSKGEAHFEDMFVDGVAQPLDFKANIYGVFLQGSYRFGAL
jgi:outer membrane protease